MAELDPFETRLTSAVRGFADGAATKVDAMAMAQQAIGRGRPRALAWLSYPLPVPVTLLAPLGLLVLALSWAVVAGAPRQDHSSVVPPVPTPTAAATPTPTPVASTDGAGPERIVRIGSAAIDVSDAGTETVVGDVLQLRGAVVTTDLLMNDPRASGTAELALDADVHASTGPTWGDLSLVGEGGSWSGRCTGATWDGRPSSASGRAWSDASYDFSCWLAGIGDRSGSTFYLQLGWRGSDPVDAQGLIYPGTIPAPSVAP